MQCQWYFINFCIDIIGIVGLSYLLLYLSNEILKNCNYKIDVGNYGIIKTEEGEYIITKEAWSKWFVQVSQWLIIITTAKLIILIIILIFQNTLLQIGVLILYPIAKYPRLLLLVVMILVPTALNSLQFWIIDEFLKKKIKEPQSNEGGARNLLEYETARSI